LSVDFGAIGTFKVGQNEVLIIEKYLAVIATDTFIVQLDRIAFFAANGDRGGQVTEDFPTVGTLDDSQG
jgi:hypothetical protein